MKDEGEGPLIFFSLQPAREPAPGSNRKAPPESSGVTEANMSAEALKLDGACQTD
jgi:hypothetical protein